jgi:16S rRNA (guanine1207-N2)-methyltransferase
MLRKSGVLWIVANRHLPYEAVLNEHFKNVRPVADAGGFKVYEARK